MDDHFWPAMYPGLIVGILYGLSLRGIFNTGVSALGGLIGAAIAYEILTAANWNDGLPSVVGLVVAAFAGAYALTRIARRFSSEAPKS
jgi:prolipoprotein diacylglyceryltransferase